MLKNLHKVNKATNHLGELSDFRIIRLLAEFEMKRTGETVSPEDVQRIVTKDGFEGYEHANAFYLWYFDNYMTEPQDLAMEPLTNSEKSTIMDMVIHIESSIHSLSEYWKNSPKPDVIENLLERSFPFEGDILTTAASVYRWRNEVEEAIK